MGKYKIITVGYQLHLENVLNISMNSHETLLDGDIIIIEPADTQWIFKLQEEFEICGHYIRNTFNHRKKEILNLLINGKVIIVFFSPIYYFYPKIKYNETIYN